MVSEITPPIGLKALLMDALKAPFFPRSVFSRLSCHRSICYRTVVPFLVIIGIVWIHIHSFLLFRDPIWSDASRWILYTLLFAAFPVVVWFGVSLFLKRVFWIFSVDLPLRFFEVAVFNFVIVWAMLPLFDIPHLFLPILLLSFPFFGTHPFHFSLIIAAVAISLEFFVFLRVWLRARVLWALLASLAVLPFAKIVLEDLGFLVEEFVWRSGWIRGKYDDSVFGFIVAVPLQASLIVWRGLEVGWSRAKIASAVFLLSAASFGIGFATLRNVTPIFPGYATDSGFLDSSDGVSKTEDFVFEDSVVFPFDPLLEPIGELRCIVQFLEGTHRAEKKRGSPKARCDFAPGPDVGEGEYAFKGDTWEELEGEARMVTRWKDPELLRMLTPRNNDVRIHVETAPGDRAVFSGVWIDWTPLGNGRTP